MGKDNSRPEMDTEYKEVPPGADEQEADEQEAEIDRYRNLLFEAYELSCEAQRHLHLFKTRPECALLILEDYLKKIEEMCSI